ncbi:hypothetical protein UFOVP1202_61 [uncultured Caudovirales phage]|uniref:Uncharacterized protein n=1 Tax=uncultured Caudovirales phage TaxID=2100421 RepID=A0A6J5RFR0_9CAUD|nr:hypothetical protein UFOVP1202_61 [uncultured Caudovirales phage]
MPTGTKGGYDKARETYAKEKDNGFFSGVGRSVDKTLNGIGTSIGNVFSGSGGSSDRSNGGFSSSQRPPARPEYLVTGTGKDAVYTNTRTGQTAAAPDYSPFSFKGLTSNDPGNYMRNREAAQRYNAMPQRESENRGYMNKDKGIAALVTPPVVTPPPVVDTPAPEAPPTPLYVPTMGYDFNQAVSNSPMGYGSAFAGLSQPAPNPFGGMNFMDIFSMYPDLRNM